MAWHLIAGNNVLFAHRDNSAIDHVPINDLLGLAGITQVNFDKDKRVLTVWLNNEQVPFCAKIIASDACCWLTLGFANPAVFSKPRFWGLESSKHGFQVQVCQWSTDVHRTVIDGRQAPNTARPSVILRPIHRLQIAFYAHQRRLLLVLNTKPTISEHWTPKWRLKIVNISSITCRQNGRLKINLFTFQHHFVVIVSRHVRWPLYSLYAWQNYTPLSFCNLHENRRLSQFVLI